MHESTRKREVELSNYHKGETKTSLKKKVKILLNRNGISFLDDLILFAMKLDVSHKLYIQNEAAAHSESLVDGFLYSHY